MMFVVRCDRCGHDQNFAPRIRGLWEVSRKSKVCVYCGKSFRVHSDFSKTRIVRELC